MLRALAKSFTLTLTPPLHRCCSTPNCPSCHPLHNCVRDEYAEASCREPDAERGDIADEVACGDEINVTSASTKKIAPKQVSFARTRYGRTRVRKLDIVELGFVYIVMICF